MITFREFLLELFDKPYKATFDVHNTALVKQQVRDNKLPIETEDLRVHTLEGDNGNLISYHRDGALEVHHSDSNDISGVLHKANKPNPRFIATMIEHLKHRGLDRGHKVRIVANNDLHKHYVKIVDRLNKKYKYKIEHNKETINGVEANTITIHPHLKPFSGLLSK
jgi:hypothetical protein